jgi:hypothetical protein
LARPLDVLILLQQIIKGDLRRQLLINWPCAEIGGQLFDGRIWAAQRKVPVEALESKEGTRRCLALGNDLSGCAYMDQGEPAFWFAKEVRNELDQLLI